MTDEQTSGHDFSGLRATFVNCTLKRSPEASNTQGLVDASAAIMRKHGVDVDEIRLVDHDVATGVWPDMREHGWENDDCPSLFPGIIASDILVVAGPIWLGDNSSQTKVLIERLYAHSGERFNVQLMNRARNSPKSGAVPSRGSLSGAMLRPYRRSR
jgi:multimeric flavodoxin WrbA